ncbi:potassium channel subfamily K member 2-like [Apostichopus japonicus]|uniref:potassium channel subfamily K member 2-like n=1 Tax=Stichopus japonicus TaxID=307972 RepID=UPI003AB6C714
MSLFRKAARLSELRKSSPNYSAMKVCILTVTFFLYLLLGSVMFHHLESKHQEQDFRFVIDRLGSFYEKHRHCIDPAEISQIVEVVLLACKDGFHHLDNTTDILNDNITDRWDLPSSFFFSATVVTTIGYGRLSPQTRQGRNACILYALLGIPLTAILLKEVGHMFKDKGILILTKIRQSLMKIHKSKTFITIATAVVGFLVLYCILICLPALVFSYTEGWSYQDAHYFCFITLTTIGFGDHVVGGNNDRVIYQNQWSKWAFKILITLYLLCGLSILAIVFNALSSGSENKFAELYKKRKQSGNEDVSVIEIKEDPKPGMVPGTDINL